MRSWKWKGLALLVCAAMLTGSLAMASVEPETAAEMTEEVTEAETEEETESDERETETETETETVTEEAETETETEEAETETETEETETETETEEAETETETEEETETDMEEIVLPDGVMLCKEIPEYGWQRQAVFPDWKGYTDDTLAMNHMVSFDYYHGQGTIWLHASEEVDSFILYVNGTRFEFPEAGGRSFSVDISGLSVDGTNTLQVSNIQPRGTKQAVEVYIPFPTVEDAGGSLEGIQPMAMKLVSDLIRTDIAYGFSSAQLAVVKNGRLVINQAWGLANSHEPDGAQIYEGPEVTTDTLYDLASVTKMFSVNYAIQKLVTDGMLDVDTRIVDILGEEFAEDTLDIQYEGAGEEVDHKTQIEWKSELTVRDILRHQGGFPAGPPYNNPDYDMALQTVGEPGCNLCYAVTREDTLAAICKTPLIYEPGTATVYSDVDYMLLTFVVESITGQRLDEYMAETFYEPMGLEHITFLPLENGFTPDDCAATELNGNTRDGNVDFEGVRTETLQGEVHDERAWYCMEGVSGHAGLFSNAADLARLASVMISGGYGENRFFSRNVIDMFTSPKSLGYSQWGLGWWREGDSQRVWYFGTQSDPSTIGHQGWTGTLVMIDPSRDLIIVYLTNKINSPITNDENPNGFDGSLYTASTLGFVPQILSIGMDSEGDITEQLLDLLADMAQGSMELIPEDAGEDHASVQNAFSKIALLRSWADWEGNEYYLDLADELEDELYR